MLNLAIMSVVCIVSIYLISKGIEIMLRGSKSKTPSRMYDMLLGIMLLVPGLAAAVFAFYWLLPGVLN